MELNEEQNEQEVDIQDIVNNLLDQNSELRLEIAQLKALLKSETQELALLQQMKQSQNIPPEVWERLSKLDIR